MADAGMRHHVRIREICSLRRGWLGEPNNPGPDIDIDPEQVIGVVDALMAQGYPCPIIVPTAEGLIELEWPNGLSIEIHTMPQPWPPAKTPT